MTIKGSSSEMLKVSPKAPRGRSKMKVGDSPLAENPTWQLILRRLPAVVWTTNRKLKITSAGGMATGELRSHLEAFVGEPIGNCFESSRDEPPPIAAHQAALAGKTTTLEYVWRRKAYQFYIEPLFSRSGKIEGCVGLAVDLTPRRHSESLFEHEISEAKSERKAPAALKRVGQRLRSEVTERRTPQSALRDAEASFLQLASSIESTFWIYDAPRDRLVYLSPNFENVWGYSVDEALLQPGNAITREAHDADRARLAEAERLQRKGESTCEEFRIRRKDGQWRWIRARAFPIVSSGEGATRIAGIAEDITTSREKDEAERRRERLATVGNFAAGVAHEVNNPLGAALAATQAAIRLAPPDATDLGECLQTTLASLRRCSHTVKCLLRFCREEPAAPTSFDLRDVIVQAESLTRAYAQEHAAEIVPRVSRRALWVEGNPLELEIVLVNLIRNAVEAGAKQVACSASKSKGEIVISVRDNGRGVDEADAKRLCDPFFTTRRHCGGTGLGLSIVHEIVRNHHGRVEFQPHCDSGMTVRIALPAASKGESNS